MDTMLRPKLRYLLYIALVAFSLVAGADERVNKAMSHLEYCASQGLDFSGEVSRQTKQLIEDYREIMTSPKVENLHDFLRAKTHKFAEDFEAWSLAVAQSTQGPPDLRASTQEQFGLLTLSV